MFSVKYCNKVAFKKENYSFNNFLKKGQSKKKNKHWKVAESWKASKIFVSKKLCVTQTSTSIVSNSGNTV